MSASGEQPADDNAIEKASRVRAAYESELLGLANVIGVGVGYRHRRGQPSSEVALIVMVRKKVPQTDLAPEDIIPRSIEGVPVDIREMGELDAFSG